jgi:FKBP-type peptidyl-prolyl cis-trans isomerase FklB
MDPGRNRKEPTMHLRSIAPAVVAFFALATCPLLPASPALAADPPVPATELEKVYYAIGFNMASNLKQQGIEVDVELVVRGLRDALDDAPNQLSDEEIRIAIQKYQTRVRQSRSQNIAKAATSNRLAGDAFLAKNKTAEGVVTLPSGLQYKVLKAGDGKKPTAADAVGVRYRGTFIDGKEFEASPPDGTAKSFKLSKTLPGWQEALKLMPAGSKWQLFVPPSLGYGGRGLSAIVGPNVTLIYEIELVSVN